MANEITHKGRVIEVDGDFADVSITPQSACGACSIKRLCNPSESKDKIVRAIVPDNISVEKGEEVLVVITPVMGFIAIFLAYLFPVLLMFTAMIISRRLEISDGIAALITLGVAVLYYVVLMLFRANIGRGIVIEIEKD